MRARALAISLAAGAAFAQEKPAAEAARFFPRKAGLVRIYEGRAREGAARSGASCEVVESDRTHVRERCTPIVGRRERPSTETDYELRRDGIFGKDDGERPRLVLPNPVQPGASWRETRGATKLRRTIRRAGGGCSAAGRPFADCLVVSVVEESNGAIRRYNETWAAGVGLVEDAQWELVDVKGF